MKFELNLIETEKQFMSAYPLLVELAVIEAPELARKMKPKLSWETYKRSKKEGYLLYAAQNSIEVYGIAGLRVLHDPFGVGIPYAIINNLIVEENFRSIGIGSAMIAKLEKIAKKSGCREIIINVLKANKKARKTYEKIGYTNIADIMLKQVKSK
jgi:ribosomal protein S18 acetylase RimI-like enzyme